MRPAVVECSSPQRVGRMTARPIRSVCLFALFQNVARFEIEPIKFLVECPNDSFDGAVTRLAGWYVRPHLGIVGIVLLLITRTSVS